MPKRTQRKHKTDKKFEEYIASDGLVLTLNPVKQLMLQKVMNSVKFPEIPTYETTTLSGRVELHPMDEESAEQTEGGLEIWEKYVEEEQAANILQNDKVLKTVLITAVDVDLPEDDDWLYELEIIGIDQTPGESGKKLDYLYLHLDQEDLQEILTITMKLSGATEEAIQEAEDSFSDTLRDESGLSESVVEPE